MTLIREVQQSLPPHGRITPGRLSLRELAEVLLPRFDEKGAHRSLRTTQSDDEARSMLYVISFTEPCPGCGARVQRDSDAGGCANVVCPNCMANFRCVTTMGEGMSNGEAQDMNLLGVVDKDKLRERLDQGICAIPASSTWQLCRLLVTAVEAAEESERLRKGLALSTLDSVGCLLTDAFAMLSQGRLCFAHVDLRRCLAECGITPTPNESRLMWHRYAGEEPAGVNFAEFNKQLRPFAMRI